MAKMEDIKQDDRFTWDMGQPERSRFTASADAVVVGGDEVIINATDTEDNSQIVSGRAGTELDIPGW